MRLYQSFDKDLPWASLLLSVNSRLTEVIDRIRGEIHQADRQSPILPSLEEISKELTTFHRLLNQLQERSQNASSHKPLLTDAQAQELLRHYYRFPNRLVNFMDGDVPIDPSLQVIKAARLILEVVIENDSLILGPLFERDTNGPLLREAQRIAGELQVVYLFASKGKWDATAARASMDFSSLIQNILGIASPNSSRPQVNRGFQELLLESQKVQALLGREGTEWPSNGSTPPEVQELLSILYQGPQSLADFLLEGDIRLLRSTYENMRQARIRLEGMEEIRDMDKAEND